MKQELGEMRNTMILMIVMMKDPDDINIVFGSPVQLVFQIKKLQKNLTEPVWTGLLQS